MLSHAHLHERRELANAAALLADDGLRARRAYNHLGFALQWPDLDATVNYIKI